MPPRPDETDLLDVDELAAGLGLGLQAPAGDQAFLPFLSSPEGYLGRSDDFAGRSAAGGPPNAYSFHGPDTNTPTRTSSQVPHVPNRWVSDPSLANQGTLAEDESDKAKEARQDGEQQHHQNNQNSHPRRPFAAPAAATTTTTTTTTTTDRHASTSLLVAAQHPHHHQQRTASRDIHEDNNKYNNTHDFYSRPTGSPPPQHRQFTPRYPSSASPSAFHSAPSHSSPAAAAAFLPPPPHPIIINRPPTTYSERSPSLFSEAPPPAYTPSPTSPLRATTSDHHHHYQTFSSSPQSHNNNTTMGRPSESEARGLLVGQTYQEIPESMGGDPDQHDDNEFTYPRPTLRERLRRFDWKQQWKMLVLAVVLLFLTVGFLVASVQGIRAERTIQAPPADPALPVTRPPVAKLPQVDAGGTRLAYPRYDAALAWGGPQGRSVCGDKTVPYAPQTFDLEFSAARNISVFQDIKEAAAGTDRPANARGVKVSGEVVVRRAAPGTPGPAVVVETITNDAGMQLGLDWDDQEQQLYILTPLVVPWDDAEGAAAAFSPCVQVRATIWAPAGAVADSLNVEGVHLGVKLLDNLSLRLNNFARLASTVGTVVAATDGEKDSRTLLYQVPPASFALDTRFVEVKTMSAAIAGSWPLADYLGLETISGAIEAGVWPKPALPDKPRPAILYARSTSGPITVHEPVAEAAAMFAVSQQQQQTPSPLPQAEDGIDSSPTGDDNAISTLPAAESFIPPRQYGVDLFTMSGAVSGSLAFGYSAKVHTTSGHVTLTLLPVLDQAQAAAAPAQRGSLVETSTTSGTTGITVMDALWQDTAAGTYVPAPVVVADDDVDADVDVAANQTSLPPPGTAVTMPNTIHTRRDDDADADAALRLLLDSRQNQNNNPALRVLSARHTATSANLYLTYPRSWEGAIDCDSVSGKIDVGGRGVQVVKREKGLPGIKQHVLAGKGAGWQAAGAALVKVHTTSGKIGVTVAE